MYVCDIGIAALVRLPEGERIKVFTKTILWVNPAAALVILSNPQMVFRTVAIPCSVDIEIIPMKTVCSVDYPEPLGTFLWEELLLTLCQRFERRHCAADV